MKSYYFISGLPRSGSTLLSAILKQNPQFYADIASPVECLTTTSIDIITCSENNFTIDNYRRKNLIYGIFDGYYKHIKNPIVFDSSRSWTKKTNFLKELFPYTKILCTVRNISSIINSFEFILSKNCFYTKKINEKVFSENIFVRAEEIFDREIVNYLSFLLEGYSINPEMIMFIEYEDLCKFPETTMKRVYEFIERPYYHHDFENIEYSNENFDKFCNVKDLHTVRKRVEYIPQKYILPIELVKKYNEMNIEFWKESYKSNFTTKKLYKSCIEYQ
jgi:sulfotransferase